jgi:putative copper resistance protein D
LIGIAVLFVVTNGGLHAAQEYLISAHVLTQMSITAVVPLLLVPAAPLSLAEQTIARRNDGSSGAAEVIDAVIRPVLSATADPVVPAVGLAATLTLLYYTPLLEYSSSTQFGYAAMTMLALLAGCLLTASVTRAFSGPAAAAMTARLLGLGGTAVFYSLNGWALAQQPDQLPDARREPWQISVNPAFDIASVVEAEPAGVAMWLIGAGSLSVATAVVLLSARRKAGVPDGRGRHAAAKELVAAYGPAAAANAVFESRPERTPQAGRAPNSVPLDP